MTILIRSLKKICNCSKEIHNQLMKSEKQIYGGTTVSSWLVLQVSLLEEPAAPQHPHVDGVPLLHTETKEVTFEFLTAVLHINSVCGSQFDGNKPCISLRVLRNTVLSHCSAGSETRGLHPELVSSSLVVTVHVFDVLSLPGRGGKQLCTHIQLCLQVQIVCVAFAHCSVFLRH